MSASASVSKPARGEGGRRRARPDETVREIPLASGGTRVERYDLLGRLRRQEEPDGSWLRFRYGLDGQLTSVEHSSGERVDYEADAEGREWRARTSRTETVIRFDGAGRPRETLLRVDGREWAVAYERDAKGGLSAVRYPQSLERTRIESEELTDAKRLTFACGGEEYCRVDSDSASGVSTIAFANGALTREEFEADSLNLRRVAVAARGGSHAREITYEHDEGGRLRSAGPQEYAYDERGRLSSCAEGGVTSSYEYDESDRLRRRDAGGSSREFGYGEGPAVVEISGGDGEAVAFEYDALGRRVLRRDARGETRYVYNFFGHLSRVELPDGARVNYVYDGCGRLVARESGGECEYYVPGLDGQRLAVADGSGRVRDSYLWLSHQCLARVRGAMGGPLFESYHRAHGGHLVGVGDAAGEVRAVSHRDPFGSDAPVDGVTPAFAGLFGDAETGLVYASARWLDPSTAQFLTPDSWFGVDPTRQMPARARRAVRAKRGGGPAQIHSSAEAYNWCRHDPVNFTDWTGHDGGRIVWSIISMLIWEQQLTVASLQLWVMDIILDILQLLIFREVWDKDGYWNTSVWNFAPPIGSKRLGSFAVILNGVLMGSRAFTLGNVVWAHHKELTDAEELGKRTLLMCSNAADYLAATNGLYGTNFVKVEKDSQILARTITFIRGQAVHFAKQFPSSFPSSSLDVKEYAPAAAPKATACDFPSEQTVLRVKQDSDLTGYAAGNFVRISGASVGGPPTPAVPVPVFLARLVDRTHAPKDIVIDVTLPTAVYTSLDVVKMDSNGAAQAAQSVPKDSTGADVATRVGAGTRTDLRRLHGVSVTETGGKIERRIVTGLVLDCTVAALPASLTGSVAVEHMNALDTPSTRARGKMSAADGKSIKLDDKQTTTFTAGQAVQVDVTGGGGGANRAFGVVDTFAGGVIKLVEELPHPPFDNNVAVTIFQMTPTGAALKADDIAAGATHVFATVDLPTALAKDDVIRVRPSASTSGGAVRVLTVAPAVVAVLDSALPASHRANLSVQVFTPDISTEVSGVSAPPLRARLVVPAGTANPYVAGEELFITDFDEEVYGKVQRVSGQDVFLETPVPWPMTTPVTAQVITPTGKATPDGKLDESVVIVPAEPSVELTRREAVENHELRHVWQEAILGPFFFSFPIPWLINLGFSFTKSAHSASQILRHISLGGLDTVFAGIVYGVGGFFKGMAHGFKDFSSNFPSSYVLAGKVSGDAKKAVEFAEATPEQMKDLSEGSYVTIMAGKESFNIVDATDEAGKKITLRFALEADDVPADGSVQMTYSPFEQTRKQISRWFSLNIGTHIAEHIPQTWGRVLANFFSRESWFPWFGVYPWALMLAGFDQTRIAPEQDAAWHSGDLYTNIPVARPNKVYQGHFSRLFAFIQIRNSRGIVGSNLSTLLQVKPPAAVTTAQVPGSTLSGAGLLRFDERYWIPMRDRAENAHGIFFNSSATGDFDLVLSGQLTKGVTFQAGFDVDFADWNKVTVEEFPVTLDPASPVFETEEVNFKITPDPSVRYTLQLPAAGGVGTINGLKYTAPLLTGGAASANQDVEVYAEYDPAHPVFAGEGQLAPTRLLPAQLKNLCRAVRVEIKELKLPAGLTVKSGKSVEFDVSIPPVSIDNPATPTPPGAAAPARVEIVKRGRPTRLKFVAPAGVTAATAVTVKFHFGATVPKELTLNVQITV